jgi:hypothetical protein
MFKYMSTKCLHTQFYNSLHTQFHKSTDEPNATILKTTYLTVTNRWVIQTKTPKQKFQY